jgi:hypothetical protein
MAITSPIPGRAYGVCGAAGWIGYGRDHTGIRGCLAGRGRNSIMYRWRKETASWTIKDTIYLSVVFSWDLPKALQFQEQSKKRVIVGGPAAKLAGIEAETLPYSPLQFHNPLATFTTRGCPNNCPFCAVPTLEGDLKELDTWEIKPVICDNNLLAASKKHFDRVIDSLKPLPFVDFNQGLDASLFHQSHARRIAELKTAKVRFSLDATMDRAGVHMAIDIARAEGLKDIGVYVLFGFDDTPAEAKENMEWVRSLGLRPNPMRYQPIGCKIKNDYILKGWTKKELEDTERYYSRLRWLEHIPVEDYRYGREEKTGQLF